MKHRADKCRRGSPRVRMVPTHSTRMAIDDGWASALPIVGETAGRDRPWPLGNRRHKRGDLADMPLVRQDGRASSDGSRGRNPETHEAPENLPAFSKPASRLPCISPMNHGACTVPASGKWLDLPPRACRGQCSAAANPAAALESVTATPAHADSAPNSPLAGRPVRSAPAFFGDVTCR